MRVHGTKGEIAFDESKASGKTFTDNNVEEIAIAPDTGGHGGGDARAIRSWLEAIRRNDPSYVMTGAQESLRTHTIMFAAEKSRREKRLVEVAELNG